MKNKLFIMLTCVALILCGLCGCTKKSGLPVKFTRIERYKDESGNGARLVYDNDTFVVYYLQSGVGQYMCPYYVTEEIDGKTDTHVGIYNPDTEEIN